MKTQPKLIDLLIRSFDQDLSAGESLALLEALQQSPHLRAEKERLLKMRQMIGELNVAVDHQFADRVMIRWKERRRNTLEALMASIFPKVAAACLLVFLLGLLAIYFSSGAISTETIIGIQELTPEDASIYLSNR